MSTEMSTEQLEKEMIRLGKGLVTNFFVLFKTSQNYREGMAPSTPPWKTF